jgi:hypothetical protein
MPPELIIKGGEHSAVSSQHSAFSQETSWKTEEKALHRKVRNGRKGKQKTCSYSVFSPLKY